MASRTYTLPSIERDTRDGKPAGELVIAGSGIATVRQLTIETLQYIQSADVVMYLVCDATTESFIQAHAKEHIDLHLLYDESKDRTETYIQMAELMLQRVRQGQLVLGLLYGHPGVFVSPSFRAIRIAQEEGYKAKMLPGISAEDCLFADLKIDPSNPGCISYEATAMVAWRQPLDTTAHLVVWQVGCVGVATMEFYKNQLKLVLDYLEEHYGPSHTVVHYIAGVYPFQKSIIERYSISDLRKPHMMTKIMPQSTFYVPPKLGKPFLEKTNRPTFLPVSAMLLADPDAEIPPSYGEYEKQVVARLAERQADETPGIYAPLVASPALRQAAIKMALEHHRLEGLPAEKRYQALKAELLSGTAPGLQDKELSVIRGDSGDALELLMKDYKARKIHQNQAAALLIVVLHSLAADQLVAKSKDPVLEADKDKDVFNKRSNADLAETGA